MKISTEKKAAELKDKMVPFYEILYSRYILFTGFLSLSVKKGDGL
jgi:hypothetical protein